MTAKDQNITPAGEVELNEEELDQAVGGEITLNYEKIENVYKTSTESRQSPGSQAGSGNEITMLSIKT